MRAVKALIGVAFVGVAVAWLSAIQAGRNSGAMLFEGARLITGVDGPPIESSAFLVEQGRITKVGTKGDVQLPPGGTRVELTGKTVIPALIDIHSHLGWTDHKINEATRTSYTRQLLTDHLQRYAYYGVAAALSMGLDRWDVNPELPYQLRNEIIPNAARFLTVGRGIAATPNAGPTVDYRLGVPYGAQTEAEGRALVHALKARKVELIKIWVDDRQKTVPKLAVNVYQAIIDEAHKNGMRVVAHIFELEDGKQLLRSGVDGFGHGVRNTDVDDDYITILKQHPKVWFGPNLPDHTLPVAEAAAEIDAQTDALPPSQIKRMRDELAGRKPGAGPSELFTTQCRNLKRVYDAGMITGLGTDGNDDIGWGVHTELADMVFCGLTPTQAIVAATRTSAEILELDDLGTVAAGKSADFIVLDANPLDAIRNTRRINRVYQRGTAVDRAALSKAFTSEAKVESATYREVENWAQLPPGTKWGGVASVAVDAKGNVYAFQRADEATKMAARVTVFDANGRHLTTWGQDAFAFPHGLRILRDGNVWTTDRQGQQVLEFDLNGKQLFSLGKRNVAGDMSATDAFNGPTDVTMAENGNLFVSDGEGPNTRVLKFSKAGKFIAMWGSKGSEPGQLQTPHCVAIDAKGRVYVCDRGNRRVQVFDQDGKYIEQMSQFAAPVSIVFSKDNTMYVAAGAPESSVWIATPEGKVIETIKGLEESPHMIAVAPDGTIYVAAAGGGEGSLVKLVKKK